MKHGTRLRPVLVVTLAVAFVGCSGSDDSSDTTASIATSSLDPTTASTETTPTSSSTTTTTVVSTSTTTTEPPVETTDTSPTTADTEPATPTDSPIADGLIASRDAYLYAVYNLDAPDAAERLEMTHAAGSPSLALARENVQTLVDNGWLARPNPDVADSITIESDVELIDDTTAELTACTVGAGEVYAPGAADDGSDLLVNGEIEAALDRVTMVLEDGRWKLREGTNLTTESGTECVDA